MAINLNKRPVVIASMMGDSRPAESHYVAAQSEMNFRTGSHDAREMFNYSPRDSHKVKAGDYPKFVWSF